MAQPFRLLATTGFKRDLERILKQNPELLVVVECLRSILKRDLYNIGRQYLIKKLIGVKPGEGQ